MRIGLRNIGANALSILTSDVTNRATSFVVYAMVARKLGASAPKGHGPILPHRSLSWPTPIDEPHPAQEVGKVDIPCHS